MMTNTTEYITIVNGKRRRTRVDVFAIAGNLILAEYNSKLDTFNIPGGGLDKDSTILDTAIREAMEESGWVCSNPYIVVDIKSNTLFTGISDRWYHECGWNEEIQVPVICYPLKYKPNDTYKGQNDAGVYGLYLITNVLNSYIKELEIGEVEERKAIQLRIRIEVLTKYLDSISLTNKLSIEKW